MSKGPLKDHAKQHARSRLASVGNAAALFGGTDGADFLTSLGGGSVTSPPAASPHEQGQPQRLGFDTVIEEEEPTSPDVRSSLRAGLSPQVLASDTGVFASSSDWDLGGTGGGQEGIQDGHEQQYAYDASGGNAGPEPTYDYSQPHSYQHDTYDNSATNSDNAVPHYDGYYYDQTTNSYLPNPETQPDGYSVDQLSAGYQSTTGEGDEQAQWAGYEGQGGYEQGVYEGQGGYEQEGGPQYLGGYHKQVGSQAQGYQEQGQDAYEGQHEQEQQSWEQQGQHEQQQLSWEQPLAGVIASQEYAPYPPLPKSPDEGNHGQPYGYQPFTPSTNSPYDPYSQQQQQALPPVSSAPYAPHPSSSVAPPAAPTFLPPPKAVAPPPIRTNSNPPPPKFQPPPAIRTNSNPPPPKFQPPPPSPRVASAYVPSTSYAGEMPYGEEPQAQASHPYRTQPAPTWDSPEVSSDHDESAARRAMGASIDSSYSSPSYHDDSAIDSLAQDFSTTHLDTSHDIHLQYGAQQESSWNSAVPEVNVEAPSPVFTNFRHVEPGPSDAEEDFGASRTERAASPHAQAEFDNETGQREYGSYPQQHEQHAQEYGFDESQVFSDDSQVFNDDSQPYGDQGAGPILSASNSGSNYGEWTGESESRQGYDYISNANGRPQQPAPANSYPAPTPSYFPLVNNAASESSYVPPSQSAYAPVSRTESTHYQPTPPVSIIPPPPTNREENPYGSPPKPLHAGYASPLQPEANSTSEGFPSNTDSFASFPESTSYLGTGSNDPYGAMADGNRTAPATYGSFSNQQSPYGSHDSSPSNGIRRSSLDQYPKQASLVADPYAAAPYDPYARKPLDRQGSSNSSVAGDVVDLGLERRNAPVVSFGFGGKVLIVFPGAARSAYGAEASPYGSTSVSTPSTVHIRKLETLYAPTESTTFPGPMFMDGGRANAGKKRKEAVAWLETRIEELERENLYAKATGSIGLGIPTPEPESKGGSPVQKIETRLILIKLVKTLVENEGRLSGTSKLDETVRSILNVPHSPTADVSDDLDLPLASDLASRHPNNLSNGSSEAPVASYNVSAANLNKISAFLLRGERRNAVKYALDHGLWAHAFVISSCVDTDCWKDVVTEFLRAELGPGIDAGAPVSNGREGLRVAYSMFAGFGGDSIQQFLPPRALALHSSPNPPSQLLPSLSGPTPISRAGTPITPHFPVIPSANPLSASVLSNWRETVAMIIANRMAGDSAALTSLGDTLMSNGWVDAAHVCYLLSPATSPIGGAGIPQARIVLVGAEAPTHVSTAGIDMESIMLTELVEFAFSFTPTVKGQETFAGFPHLQAFRLLHAVYLADSGQVSQSQRYTDAIVNTLKLATRASPFYNATLVAQVKALSDRLAVSPGHEQDKAGSWITRNVPRPTIDSLWTTLEGRFTKFVAGEGESANPALPTPLEATKSTPASAIGPFSHYSSIAPATSSGPISRTNSQSDLVPVSTPSSYPIPTPLHTSTGPPPVSRPAFKTHHSRSSSLGYGGYDYDANAAPSWQKPSFQTDNAPASQQQGYGDSNEYGYNSSEPTPQEEDGVGGGNNDSGWWGSESRGGSAVTTSANARAPAFLAVQESFAEDASGFISPMAAYSPSPSPGLNSTYSQSQQREQSHKRTSTRDELDDLGIGNSKSRRSGFASIDEQAGEGEDGGTSTPATNEGTSTPSKADEDKSNVKASRSWLGGWFKREASPQASPGPVKANLGEQISLVYDADLKRWVNKKGGDSGAAPEARPPPPSRAATASPTRAARGHAPPARYRSETPPIPRRDTDGPLFQTASHAAPSLNRARTSADLNSDMLRAGPGQFRSSSTGPPPPMPSRPSSAAGSAGSGGGPGAGVRRKPLNKRYVAIS